MDSDFYTAPPHYAQYQKKLREMKTAFPFLQLFPIGKSVLGRSIYAISIGASSPCTLFVGATHAQEWLTCSLLLRFTEELCQSLRQKSPIAGIYPGESLSIRGLTLIPMLNPDGVSIALEGADSAGCLAPSVRRIQSGSEKSWQANGRGVDLNHNFNAGFRELQAIERQNGIFGPAPRQFGGSFPHSEPETQAVAALLRERSVQSCYAFHSQGEEIYSEYGSHTPAQSRYILRLLCEASGYTPVENAGLCSHGGLKDYFIARYRRPGFTIEIGKGENPLPITDLDPIYEQLREMLLIAAVI